MMIFFLRIEYRLPRDFSPAAQNDGCCKTFRFAQNDGRGGIFRLLLKMTVAVGFFACGSK
ncbi:MAG: hypothetical protein J6M05_03185 [Cardiobacteriaceae bacterium]|nr:hypothetical protein [Cardiobacteriaceae bacterium]